MLETILIFIEDELWYRGTQLQNWSERLTGLRVELQNRRRSRRVDKLSAMRLKWSSAQTADHQM